MALTPLPETIPAGGGKSAVEESRQPVMVPHMCLFVPGACNFRQERLVEGLTNELLLT